MTGTDKELRRRLADELESCGDLRTPHWRHAIEVVPRHLFLPEFFRRVDAPNQTMWEPVTPDHVSTEEWLQLVYQNETWVTQIDRKIRPNDVSSAIAGIPTSSSTLPGLVVRMLEDLDISNGHNVLEIGTGTGYSTALICERLGAKHITSVETDPTVASNATQALHDAGYDPTLVTGDGIVGYLPRAPYDRIIATCSFRRIPDAWIAQSNQDAIILATLSGWLHGSGYAALKVKGDGIANGRFLPGTISFMLARPHTAPPIDISQTGTVDTGEARSARVSPEILDDWDARFIAQLAAPGAQHIAKSVDGGPMVDYLIDTQSGSYASITPEDDGESSSVREVGQIALWGSIEDAILGWKKMGSPPIETFTIDVTPAEQTVSCGPLRWNLPQ
jgi:methyltransferase of ATP-grasp peptide maturase system